MEACGRPSKQGKIHPGAEVVEKLADRKDMCALHDNDAKWADMFRDTVFVDYVNGGELDKHLVIEARKTEVEFFEKTAVYRKVPRSKVKKQRGKIISMRWVNTNNGYRGNANYRSRLVAREITKDQRQDLFSATPPLETLKLLVADCAKSQRHRNLRRQQGALLRARDAALFIHTPDENWGEGDEGWPVTDQPSWHEERCAELGGHMHQVLGQDRVPEEQSVQLNFFSQKDEHQDDSARE